MSQYDFGSIDPTTTSGTALATLINSYRDAVNSGHIGASRPTYAVNGMLWVKEVSSTVNEVYHYDGTDDILLYTVNPTANTTDIAKLGTASIWTALQTLNAGVLVPTSSAVGNCHSGVFTPTLSNATNITASTAYECQYMRLGNVCTVSGRIDINATAAGRVVLSMTLPVASDITDNWQVGGTISLYTTAAVVANGCISGVTAANTAEIRLVAASSGNAAYWFHYTYRIL